MLKICTDLPQTFLICLLVQLLQQWDVSLKVFIVVAHVYKSSKERWWKNDLESLPVFFHGVQEPQTSQTVHLKLMLHFEIFARIAVDVDFGIVPIELRAVVHEQTANNVRPVQPYLDIVRIVQR